MKPDVAMDWQINRAPSPRGEGIPASMFLPNPLQSSSRTPIPGKLTAPHLLGRLTAPSNAARGRAYFVNPPYLINPVNRLFTKGPCLGYRLASKYVGS
jgi:hypothetical protein